MAIHILRLPLFAAHYRVLRSLTFASYATPMLRLLCCALWRLKLPQCCESYAALCGVLSYPNVAIFMLRSVAS
jgi:hypothetical protein